MQITEAQRIIRNTVDETWQNCRVVLPRPPVKKGKPRPRPDEAIPAARSTDRDETSGWTLLIEYRDSGGYESERMITLIRCEDRMGGHFGISAYCHEAAAFRLFRLDRITAMALAHTGEIVDPVAHITELKEKGLPYVNRGMQSIATILLFLARCDGRYHPAEWDAIEDSLSFYALRFGGTEEDVANAMLRCRQTGPDADDFYNAWLAISRTPREYRRDLMEFLWRACAAIIDADGELADQEVEWARSIRRLVDALS